MLKEYKMPDGTDLSLYSMTIRLLLSLVMGALIGVDRETAGHPVGVRTFSLVCLGACITMVTDLQKMKSQSLIKSDIAIVFTIDMKKRRRHEPVLEEISELPYVRYIEEIK
jgi:putative Mg2+ transporter-C (MgtC) family protein